jgi:hypothetical protein
LSRVSSNFFSILEGTFGPLQTNPHGLYVKYYPVGIFLLQKPKSAPPKSKSFTLPKAHPIRGFFISAPLLRLFDKKAHTYKITITHGLYVKYYPVGIFYCKTQIFSTKIQKLHAFESLFPN